MENQNSEPKVKFTQLFTIDRFLKEIPSKNPKSTRMGVEIAGKDSVAAIIKILDEFSEINKDSISEIVGFGMYHTAFYGNFNEPKEHFEKIKEIIYNRYCKIPMRFYYIDVAELFEKVIIRPMTIVQKLFGAYSPCPACHLFFHMMRVPLLHHIGSSILVSGERSAHGSRLKLNQVSEVLSLFPPFLRSHNIKLLQPLFNISDNNEIYKLLGTTWKNAKPYRCIFSKNYLDESDQIYFKISDISDELKLFYYPLFAEIVEYTQKFKKTPNDDWLKNRINEIVLKIKNIKKKNLINLGN
ncbi:hypothetical protein [Candidatus Harpocratesius sp.]